MDRHDVWSGLGRRTGMAFGGDALGRNGRHGAVGCLRDHDEVRCGGFHSIGAVRIIRHPTNGWFKPERQGRGTREGRQTRFLVPGSIPSAWNHHRATDRFVPSYVLHACFVPSSTFVRRFVPFTSRSTSTSYDTCVVPVPCDGRAGSFVVLDTFHPCFRPPLLSFPYGNKPKRNQNDPKEGPRGEIKKKKEEMGSVDGSTTGTVPTREPGWIGAAHHTRSALQHHMRGTWKTTQAIVNRGRIGGKRALAQYQRNKAASQDVDPSVVQADRSMVRTQATQAREEQSTRSGNENMQVVQIPSLKDNYIYLIKDAETGTSGIVDPAEAAPVLKYLTNQGERKVDFILNTHHHHDHVGGNEELKRNLSCRIVGAEADKHRIPGIDITVREGSTFAFGAQEVHVFETPGHTSGHICYWFPASKSLFVGDTLFALGCGRLFEGTAEQMWNSLNKIMQLPRDTMVYCAHEYTQANSRFAVHVDGTNEALLNRKKEIEAKRKNGIATVPFLLGEDMDTNPFLRPFDTNVRVAMGMSNDETDVKVFAAVRKSKDVFAG